MAISLKGKPENDEFSENNEFFPFEVNDPSPQLIRFLRIFIGLGLILRLGAAVGSLLADSTILAQLFVCHSLVLFLILILLRIRSFDWVIVFMGLELALLSIQLLEVFGTAPLFHIYVFALSPIALLFEHYPPRMRWLMVLIPLIAILLSAVFLPGVSPMIELSTDLAAALSYINLGLLLALCLAVIQYYMRSTQEQKRRAETLLQERTRLMADMSHEMKTPLATILAKSQATLLQTREASAYRQALELCERNALKMKTLTSRLLDELGSEAPSAKLRLEEIHLAEFLRIFQEDLRPLAASKGFRIDLNCPPELRLQTDRTLLEAILQNLVINAFEHAQGGDRVEISVVGGPPVRISVCDNGPGVAEELRRHLFEPFFRGDPSRRQSNGNLGLGLSIAQKNAQRLSAELRLSDAKEGEGACFQLFFDD